jgi:hypothetical protein
MSARWRCWTGMEVLDGQTVLLDGSQLDERTLALLDRQESSGLGYKGVD